MRVDQNSNMPNSGEAYNQNPGSNVSSSRAKMDCAPGNRQIGLGNNLIQQLVMANLLGDNGIGLQNKLVAGI